MKAIAGPGEPAPAAVGVAPQAPAVPDRLGTAVPLPATGVPAGAGALGEEGGVTAQRVLAHETLQSPTRVTGPENPDEVVLVKL